MGRYEEATRSEEIRSEVPKEEETRSKVQKGGRETRKVTGAETEAGNAEVSGRTSRQEKEGEGPGSAEEMGEER